MFDFIAGVVNAVVDFLTGGRNEAPSPPDPCDVGDCLAAKEQLAAARSHFQNACHWVGLLKATLIVPQWIVSRSIGEIVVVLVIAFLIAGPMGLGDFRVLSYQTSGSDQDIPLGQLRVA